MEESLRIAFITSVYCFVVVFSFLLDKRPC
jgi:hypothetical protein